MPCYHPIPAWRSVDGSGKMTFHGPTFPFQKAKQLPCGQCIGCRLDRSRQWAIRCIHEAQLYEENCFITLTFSPEALEKRPIPMSIDLRDWQLFMKRLRKSAGGRKIRYFHCGEYGENLGRPHYHACLFNYDFADKKLWKENNGQRIYTSKILEKIWGQGFCTIGTVTFESAAYVARYIMKKVTGDLAADHYDRFDLETGEINQLKPEYISMSKKPGLGHGWLEKYQTDVFPSDEIIINGKSVKVPRYYDNQFQMENADQFTAIQKTRIKEAKKHLDNNTSSRLAVREHIMKEKLKNLPRNRIGK